MSGPTSGPTSGRTSVAVRPMTPADWSAVERIHAAGIATGHATFEPEPAPTWAAFDASHLTEHRLVAEPEPGVVAGWAAVCAVSPRAVYAGVVEHSVYVDPAHRGHGAGRALLAALVASTEAAGAWTLQAGIFPENAASLALHRDAGFTVVGTRHHLGLMTFGPLAGQWRDVLLLERRSTVAGT
jgi:L-amino acid N-acyltransferase YncA